VVVLRCSSRTCHHYADEDDVPSRGSFSPESAMAPLGPEGITMRDKTAYFG
jgi:hypothetical protein